MGIRKSAKVWASVSAAALLTTGALSACGDNAEVERDGQNGSSVGADHETPAELPAELAGEGAGEGGGEGGEEGGEMGIDPEEALRNPVVYRSAIEVMRAHYIAGLAAMEMGDRANASALFSHPISEIYVDLEPVIEELGGQAMMDELNQAAVLHYQGANEAEIVAAVETVLDLLDANLAVAPTTDESEAHVRAAVIAELIERASLQYGFALEQASTEAWLDGYGLYGAAQQSYTAAQDSISAENAALNTALLDALTVLGDVYDQPTPPETPTLEPQVVLAAAEAVRAAE